MAKQTRQSSNKKSQPQTTPSLLHNHPHTVFLGLLAVLLVVFFHEAFFAGKVFNVPDNLSAIQYEQGYLQKADKDGVNPFWNPYIFCGMPTWGSSSPGHGLYLHTFLDPFKPMLILQIYGWVQSVIGVLPLPVTFWDIFNYFLLGLFTYLFGLRRKFEPFTAFLVAVSVVFSLYSLNWIMAGHNTKITVFAWLPAILLLVDHLFEKKSLLSIALLTVAFHLTFNSGHIQMIFYSLLTVFLYVLYKWYDGAKVGQVAMVGTIVAATAIFAFLMLSGPYFATWEYKDFSIRGAGSGGSGHASTTGGLDYDYATNWSFSPLEVTTFFVPSFVGFGSPTYWGTMPFTESPIYLGIVISFLALIGIVLRPKDRFVHFWIVLGLLSLLISFGRNFGLLYDVLFNNLPFFNNFRIPSMILFLNSLCVGMLAGVGVSELLRRVRSMSKASTAEETRWLTKAIWIPAGIAGLLFLVLLFSKDGMKESIASNMQKYQPQSWNLVQQVQQAVQAGQSAQIPKEYRKATVDEIYGMAVDDALVALVFVTLVALLLWMFARNKLGLMTVQAGLLVLLVVDWWIVDYKPMHMEPRQRQQQALEKSETVGFLEQDKGLFRILPVSAHGGDNYYVAFGIQSVAGYHPAKMKYLDDIRNTLFNQFQFQTPQSVEQSHLALLSMMNTKYIIVPTDFTLQVPWLRRVFAGGREQIYENEYVLPRVFFVGRHEVIEDDEAMFRKIATMPGYEPDKVAYLSNQQENLPAQVPDSIIALSGVEVKSYGMNSMELEVETPVDAILKVSETYYPSGWTATLVGSTADVTDEKPVDIIRTDYAFRAIVVPAGKHTVRFEFVPRSYSAGLIVTTVTNYFLAAVLLVYVVAWVRKRIKLKTPAASK